MRRETHPTLTPVRNSAVVQTQAGPARGALNQAHAELLEHVLAALTKKNRRPRRG